MREVGLKRIYQPPYSPEVNPAERVFEEVRRYVEGRVNGSIEAKKAALEEVLRRVEAEERLSTLVGMDAYPGGLPGFTQMIKRVSGSDWYNPKGQKLD